MRHIFSIFLLCSAVVCFPRAIHASVVEDPLAHYVTHFAYYPDDHVLSFTVTLDETSVVFISLTSLVDGRAGNIWEAYVKESQGYRPLEEPLSFRKDALVKTSVKGIDYEPLMTYFPGGGGKGVLRAIHMKDGRLVDETLGTIEPDGKDRELYTELFDNDAIRVSVEDKPVAELLASKGLPPNEKVTGTKEPLQTKNLTNLQPIDKSEGSPRAEAAQAATASMETPWMTYSFGAILLGIAVWLAIAMFGPKR